MNKIKALFLKSLLLVALLALPSFAVQKYTSSYQSLTNVTGNVNGTSVKIANVDSFTVYWSYTMTTTPSATTIVEISPNGSTWYTQDSQTKTATGKHVVTASNVNAQYVRARSLSLTNATVSANIIIGSVR